MFEPIQPVSSKKKEKKVLPFVHFPIFPLQSLNFSFPWQIPQIVFHSILKVNQTTLDNHRRVQEKRWEWIQREKKRIPLFFPDFSQMISYPFSKRQIELIQKTC